MKKTLRDVEVDSDKFALLMSLGTQNLLATTGCLMNLTLKPLLEFPRSATSGPASKTGIRCLLTRIVHGDRTCRIKRVSNDSPTLPAIQGSE
jgi:hypothetical protein